MRRDHSAWLLAGPLVAAAALLAHALAYRLAPSDPQLAADHSAHHYLAHVPLLIAPAGLAVAIALALRFARVRAGGPGARLPWAPIAVAPVPLFAVQETVEGVAHTGALDPAHATRPAFLLGLAFAAAFAVAALLVGRLLLRSADRAAHVALRTRASLLPAPTVTAVPRPAGGRRIPRDRAGARRTGRAPPSPVAA